MSVPSNVVSIFDPQIPVDQSIYEQSSTQKAKLGTRLAVGDRVFRYAQLSTSANALCADLLCCPVMSASHVGGVLTVSAATTGATTVTVTASASIAANFYDEGYLSVSSTGLAGGGWMFRIKSQPAGATPAISLYDPIPGTIAAGPGSLTPCLYKNVKVGTTLTELAAGVAPIAVTTGNYFWLQTWGPAVVKCSANHAAGLILYVGASGGAAGVTAITELTAGGMPIGKVHSLAVASGSNAWPVFLTINP